MTLSNGLVLGSAASLISLTMAHAADLPERQAAPIEYVRICDAYGAGFFYIPGTDTCLKVGGLALTEIRSYDAGYSISGNAFQGNGVAALGAALPTSAAVHSGGGATSVGFVPTPTQYNNARQRDNYGWNSLGRIELDARTGTPWGVLRSFIRVDSFVGTGYSQTGALSTGTSYNSNPYNTSAGVTAVRETTIVNKAFIQFAGLTAGRAQSMFDFYANAYNYQRLGGSAATTQLLAYTYAFGNALPIDGLSATLSVEDKSARETFIGSTIASATPTTIGGITSTAFQGTPGGVRFPDIVGNLRVDQPWGAAQLSAAGHQINATLFPTTALATTGTTYAFPAASTNSYGWAIQGGIQLNMDRLNIDYLKADKLWVQAAYEQGAFNYVYGDNFASSFGAVNGNRYYGSAYTPADTSAGWNPNVGSDCVFTLSGVCERQSGWGVTAAYKHYWLPTLASAIYGSYLEINYSNNALAGFGGAVGVSNLKTGRAGANLVWTPIKGFDIGAEFMYVNVTTTRPAGLAPDAVLKSVGLPGYKGTENEYEGRVRIQRAF
jgi:hypothetical protein